MRLLVFTGNGKGKTTAALGMVLRASGHGMRSLVLQFIKHDPRTGETEAVRHLPGVELVKTGRGFVPPPESPRFLAHKEAAKEGLERARQALAGGAYDVVVLDEACTAVSRGLFTEEALVQALSAASPGITCVLTGRGATPGLVDLADTVTEMREVKHAFHGGRRAEKGVEY